MVFSYIDCPKLALCALIMLDLKVFQSPSSLTFALITINKYISNKTHFVGQLSKH